MRQANCQDVSNSLWALAKLSEHGEGDTFGGLNGFENFMIITFWAHSEQLHVMQATAQMLSILTGSSRHSLQSSTCYLGA